MRPILLSVLANLLITSAFCENIPGQVTVSDNKVVERASLKDRLMTALDQGDLGKQDEIDRLYGAAPKSWLVDAAPLYEARYQTLRNRIGTEGEDRELDGIAGICDYVRKIGDSPLFSKLEKDYNRANPYTFPEHLRMAGWPQPGDKHQLKGVRGQILATMVAVNSQEFLKEHIKKTAGLARDSNEKLLGIWALGYSVLPEASDYLKGVAISGSDREKALAISALNYLVLQMTKRVKEGVEMNNDWLANMKKFLADHAFERSVTAGEYFPF